MYQARFAYVYGALIAVGTAGVIAFLGWSAFGQQVRVATRTVPQAGLSSTSSVADVKGRFQGQPSQTVPGTELGLEGGTCDVYLVADGGVLVCHG